MIENANTCSQEKGQAEGHVWGIKVSSRRTFLPYFSLDMNWQQQKRERVVTFECKEMSTDGGCLLCVCGLQIARSQVSGGWHIMVVSVNGQVEGKQSSSKVR